MKLWKISQTVNEHYDTYDAAIVAAETEDEARKIHPSGPRAYRWWEDGRPSDWALPTEVTAIDIGAAPSSTQPGVILASFNAG